jgi:hypothetical protein
MVLLKAFNGTSSACDKIENILQWSKKNVYVGIVLNKFQIS